MSVEEKLSPNFASVIDAIVEDATRSEEHAKSSLKDALELAKIERDALIACVRHYAYWEHSGTGRAKSTLRMLGIDP